jgi:hypothetical protein
MLVHPAADPERAHTVLVHEMVHAQQDAESDLSALVREDATYDEALAARAIVEGEAQVAMYRHFAALKWQDPYRVTDYEIQVTKTSVSAAARDASGDAADLDWRSFVYAFGAAYAHARERVQAPRPWLADPPVSTREVIARARSGARSPSPVPPLTGYEALHTTSLGAWRFYTMLARHRAVLSLDDVATSWGGDCVTVYERSTGELAVVWQIDTTLAPSIAYGGAVTFTRDGSAFVVAAERGEDLEAWTRQAKEPVAHPSAPRIRATRRDAHLRVIE